MAESESDGFPHKTSFEVFRNARRSSKKIELFGENREKFYDKVIGKSLVNISTEENHEKQTEKQSEVSIKENAAEKISEKQPQKQRHQQPAADSSERHKNDSHLKDFSPDNAADHFSPSVRLVKIRKSPRGLCGFYLTRSKWDPYPWVSAVDAATPAERSGLKAGDCLLEVNGADVLGLRIKEVAELIKAKTDCVTLLLWNTGGDFKCDPESLCCGPMPLSLQRLSVIVQNVLSIIECPVCLDTIRPPVLQCQNGHLLCLECRIRAEKCPVCRDRYTPRRAMIAEQIYAAITNAFSRTSHCDKLRQQLFGSNAQVPRPTAAQLPDASLPAKPHKQKANTRHKILAMLLGKAYSMDNLTDSSVMPNDNQGLQAGSWTSSASSPPSSRSKQSAPNQLQYSNAKAAATMTTACGTGSGPSAASSCTTTMTTLSSTSTELSMSEVREAKTTFEHFSSPPNDLSPDEAAAAIDRHSSEQQLSTSNSRCSKNTSSAASTSALKLQTKFSESLRDGQRKNL